MNADIKTEAQSMWRKLLVALAHVDCFRVELAGSRVTIYEPESSGVYYTMEQDFVIVAIGCDQLAPGRTEEFFNSRRIRASLRGILGRDVETVAQDGTLYFMIPTHQALEPLAA